MNFIRGEILYDINFMYPAAAQNCDKLLLIINKSHTSGQDVVIIPATTHIDNYSYKPNCNEIEKVFYFDTKIGFYNQKTILQLFLIDIISMDFVNTKLANGDIRKLTNTATQEELGRILNCLKKMKDDIPFYIHDLIF